MAPTVAAVKERASAAPAASVAAPAIWPSRTDRDHALGNIAGSRTHPRQRSAIAIRSGAHDPYVSRSEYAPQGSGGPFACSSLLVTPRASTAFGRIEVDDVDLLPVQPERVAIDDAGDATSFAAKRPVGCMRPQRSQKERGAQNTHDRAQARARDRYPKGRNPTGVR